MASTNDPFDFSRLFGNMTGFSLPGLVTPTLDIDELDKKIKDLKAVEGWLSMNLSMLQMSIQGLEVQRNTLSSIKAMGEAFNKGMEEAQRKPEPTRTSAPTKAPEANQPDSAEQKEATTGTDEDQQKPVWPWELAAQAMQDLHEQLQHSVKTDPAKNPSTAEPGPTKRARQKPSARASAPKKPTTTTTESGKAAAKPRPKKSQQ